MDTMANKLKREHLYIYIYVSSKWDIADSLTNRNSWQYKQSKSYKRNTLQYKQELRVSDELRRAPEKTMHPSFDLGSTGCYLNSW
jgi:hypothetical protein